MKVETTNNCVDIFCLDSELSNVKPLMDRKNYKLISEYESDDLVALKIGDYDKHLIFVSIEYLEEQEQEKMKQKQIFEGHQWFLNLNISNA